MHGRSICACFVVQFIFPCGCIPTGALGWFQRMIIDPYPTSRLELHAAWVWRILPTHRITHNRYWVAVPAALSSARVDGAYIGIIRHRRGQYIALQPINTVSLINGGSGKNSGALCWTMGGRSMNECWDQIGEVGRSIGIGGKGGPKASST